ncbi:hypothetical protein G7Y89_g14590 [Cudoniella acicularis]|uniref:DUF7702 domain-containing protein n=1 Tax=Cudoniella acicularis TaxID=354080 RepID=A0A8H4VRJ9_9HELO|nr:hypothetical protein G7Y89_g14590 [Cudoniella acicularis]
MDTLPYRHSNGLDAAAAGPRPSSQDTGSAGSTDKTTTKIYNSTNQAHPPSNHSKSESRDAKGQCNSRNVCSNAQDDGIINEEQKNGKGVLGDRSDGDEEALRALESYAAFQVTLLRHLAADSTFNEHPRQSLSPDLFFQSGHLSEPSMSDAALSRYATPPRMNLQVTAPQNFVDIDAPPSFNLQHFNPPKTHRNAVMISTTEAIAIAEICVYTPISLLTTITIFHHGFKRQSGWIYLFIFCLVRIIGAAFKISSASHPTSTTDAEWAAILQSVGLSPLLLASLGLLKRVTDFVSSRVRSEPEPGTHIAAKGGLIGKLISKRATAASRRSRIIQLSQIPIVLGLIFCVIGGTDATSTNPSDAKKGPTFTKIGIVIFLAAYILLTSLLAITARDVGNSPREEKRLYWVVVAAIPFLGAFRKALHRIQELESSAEDKDIATALTCWGVDVSTNNKKSFEEIFKTCIRVRLFGTPELCFCFAASNMRKFQGLFIIQVDQTLRRIRREIRYFESIPLVYSRFNLHLHSSTLVRFLLTVPLQNLEHIRDLSIIYNINILSFLLPIKNNVLEASIYGDSQGE